MGNSRTSLQAQSCICAKGHSSDVARIEGVTGNTTLQTTLVAVIDLQLVDLIRMAFDA